MAKGNDLVLESLRGGVNNDDPPNALQMDECTIANNVEFFESTLGERRRGCQSLDMTGSGLTTEEDIVFLTRHFPSENEVDNELWAVAATENTTVSVARRTTSAWSAVTPPDPISPNAPDIYSLSAQSLDGKLFIACPKVGDIDRMLVWDGTDLRRSGLAQPEAPVVTNTGSGVYDTERYFRVRFVKKDGSTVLLRSEPSDTTTFTPSGSGSGAIVNMPALLNEGETHWEVEASLDDANFYVIASVVIGTTTYVDTTDAADGYADLGDLSEDIGSYQTLPSARFVAADDDRLILGGSFVDPDLASRVMWTPVRNDPGSGNSERLAASTDYYIDLDSYEGGGLTGLSQAISGSWYAFKWSQIYKLVRTGNRQDAYQAITLSKARGALPGSIVSGMDEYGRPCVYFLDPRIGPSRISVSGLQQINGIRGTWKTVNASAEKVVSRGVYYPDKQQVWWWVATDGSNVPNLRLVLQVNELREAVGGVRRGWSTADGKSAEAYTACVLTEQMEDQDGNLFLSTRPILGLPGPDFIQRGDINDTDNGEAYIARIRTRPLFTAGLLNRWGAMTAALLAKADADAQVSVKFIRNFGLETNEIVTPLAPEATEEYVIKAFDNLAMSSAVGIQIEFSDVEDIDKVAGTLYHSEP